MDIKSIKENVNYCLNCKVKPCSIKGCPLQNNIPEIIKLVKEENFEEAYREISKTTVLPGICGRICPHKKQCEGSCIRGIKGTPVSIGEIEAFVFDKFEEDEKSLEKFYCSDKQESNQGKKVAIIGGGPAGLSCAAFLAKEGIDVTIYEKYDYLGGLLVHGIPEFRLPKEIVKKTVDKILKLGVKVEYNKELGKNLYIEALKREFDAVFISIGANVSSKMKVEGEELNGVYGGNELLEYKLHPTYEGKKVAVVGGGNVAMDCARTVKKLGAKEVTVIYRRAREQMPAEDKEIEDALKEGIKFSFQTNIKKIIGKDNVEKMELVKMDLIQKEGESRLVPIEIENSNFKENIDYIIMALGSTTCECVKELGVNLNKWNNIEINDNYQTSDEKIFAGGDVAGVKQTVAWAAKSGREAAKAILNKLCK